MEAPPWEPDPDVKAELEAMGGYKYTLGEAGISDTSISEAPKRKIKKRKTKIVRPKKPKPAETTTISTSGMADQTELLNIMKQPAFTSEEKYRVLEARDKLIRIRTKKSTDITSAKHIVGTCPDMCPEKERLMREVQHQVSVYEQETGEKTMNPFLAIKQYSRSSADQEVPLPHELRPVSILQRTISYLLNKIVDLCDAADVNFSEWYHFLWDRTRAIRKDITQQELCCKGSVELVEQCARFHIHCSARLVAEDLSVFDQKINTENLTKCLQTLKYMYHDLELKNESCPNEAEFRAYVILLNLNDANFMWEVQHLRKEIQKSQEVQFALQVYSALDKNNYVRFFKLVRSTTYLNACILLRYFIQVRLQALTTIIKSHSPRSPHTQFPLTELEQILAFEENASTMDFIEYHGLQLNENRTHVILDRRMFKMQELPYTLDRAINVIESKRRFSVGEVICGRSLTPIDIQSFIPHDSFDPNGCLYIGEYLPDIDLTALTKDNEKEKITKVDNKNIFEDKSNDSFSKNLQSSVFQTSIFAFKSSSDSRSNSPMDVVDRATESKAEPTPFWAKSEKATTSIFRMPEQDASMQIPSIFGSIKPNTPLFNKPAIQVEDKPIQFGIPTTQPIFNQPSKPIFSSTPMFSKIDQKPAEINPFAPSEQNMFPPSSETNKNLFQPPEASISFAPPSTNQAFSKIDQKPAGTNPFAPPEQNMFASSLQTNKNLFPPPEASTSFAPRPTDRKPGGFSFNLKTTMPSVGFPTEKIVPFFKQDLPARTPSIGFSENKVIPIPNQELQIAVPSIVFTSDTPSAGFSANKVVSFPKLEFNPMENREDLLKAQKEKAAQMQKQLEEKLRLEKERLEKEKKKRLEEEERKKWEAERKRIALEEAHKRIIKEEAEKKKKKQEKLEIERKRKERKLEKLRKQAKELEEKRIQEIKNMVFDVVDNLIVRVECSVRDEKLKNIKQKVKLRQAGKYFEKWKNSVIINKRKRKAIDRWPIWVSDITLGEEAVALHANHQDETLKYMKRYKGGIPINIDLDKELKVDKINLQKLTHNILSKKFRDSPNHSQHNFWKIDIFTASLSYTTTNLKWIDKILGDLFSWKDENCTLIEKSKISTNKITYCIKKCDGYKQEDTNGYLFIGDALSNEFYKDIKKMIKISKPAVTPAVILLQSTDYKDKKLDDLVNNGYIANYKVLSKEYTPDNLVSLIEEGLIYLANNVPKIAPLELDTLRSFLHKYLATEIWEKMTSFTKWNLPYKICLTNPKIVIALYNQAVSRLQSIAFGESSRKFLNFPDVFHEHFTKNTPLVLPCDYRYFPSFWKNDSYRRKIKRVFANLHLPQFETQWPPKDAKALEKIIKKFCQKFFKDPQKKAYKIIAGILTSLNPNTDFDNIKNVLWTDIIEVLIIEKLKEIDFSLREPFLSQAVFNELFVIYNKNDLNDYYSSMWFYVNNPIIKKELNVNEYTEDIDEEEEEIVIEESEDEDLMEDIDFESSFLDIAQERYDREEKLNASKTDLKEFEELMADLEKSMNIQKQISERFEDTLSRALYTT